MEIDDSVVIPRINSSMFREFKNRKVRVVGQVISNQGDVIILKTSDEGNVRVIVNHYNSPFNTKFVEVVGQITGEDAITETSPSLSLGDNFDIKSYDKLIHYQKKLPDIF